MRLRLPLLFLIASGLTLPGRTSAAATTWISPTGGLWNAAANWSDGLPGPGADSVTIASTAAATTTVTVPANTAPEHLGIRRLTLGGGRGPSILRLEGLGAGTLRLTSSLNIDEGGVLEIVGSGLELNGAESGGGFHLNAGSMLLDGGSWRVIDAVSRIGRTGSGTATLLSGHAALGGDLLVGDLPGSAGEVTLRGATLTVSGGLFLGDDPGSSGSLVVHLGSLAVHGDNLRIGDDGTGRMHVAGGEVTSTNVSVGRAPGSVGHLQVTGGTLRCGHLSIGRFAGATGTAEIEGGLLDLGPDTLYVGREGAGALNVRGGQVVAGALVVAALPSASGRLNLSGGALQLGQWRAGQAAAGLQITGGTIEVGEAIIRTGQPLVIGNGVDPAVLRLGPGDHVFADGLIIETGSRLEGEGTVVGPLTVKGVDGRTGGLQPPAAPLLQLAATSGALELRFESDARAAYVVESADPAVPAAWRDVTIALRGTGAALRIPLPNNTAGSLFRVRVRAATP